MATKLLPNLACLTVGASASQLASAGLPTLGNILMTGILTFSPASFTTEDLSHLETETAPITTISTPRTLLASVVGETPREIKSSETVVLPSYKSDTDVFEDMDTIQKFEFLNSGYTLNMWSTTPTTTLENSQGVQVNGPRGKTKLIISLRKTTGLQTSNASVTLDVWDGKISDYTLLYKDGVKVGNLQRVYSYNGNVPTLQGYSLTLCDGIYDDVCHIPNIGAGGQITGGSLIQMLEQ